MPELTRFTRYGGSFPTTASVAGALAYQGVTAQHTGAPYTEAFLMGIAGGIAFGSFTFAYEGFDPQANILTRNTFNDYGWDAVVARLGISRDVAHSTTEAGARRNLVRSIEEGRPPIVWADVFTLGYETSELGDAMWSMQPMIVTAYAEGGEATICDRARVPIVTTADRLDAARARVKKERHRLETIESPDEPDLRPAVREGIADCIRLYTEKPPQGSASNFGFRAYDRWIAALREPESKSGWAKPFAPGRPFFAGLTTAFRYALLFWKDDSLTADRRLLVERHTRFLAGGNREIDRLQNVDARLETLRAAAATELQDGDQAVEIMAAIADRLEEIRDAERGAVDALRDALG